VSIRPAQLNVNNPIAKWAGNPANYLESGWYDLSPERGRWYFRRRDPVIVLDPWGQHPILCHVSFIDRHSGWIMTENRINGFTYGSIRPDANRIFPVDLFHPLHAKFADLP
jgi:hypothetical protein